MKPSLRILPVLFAVSLVAQLRRSPLPAPPDIPNDATVWMLLVDKSPSGQDAAWTNVGYF